MAPVMKEIVFLAICCSQLIVENTKCLFWKQLHRGNKSQLTIIVMYICVAKSSQFVTKGSIFPVNMFSCICDPHLAS